MLGPPHPGSSSGRSTPFLHFAERHRKPQPFRQIRIWRTKYGILLWVSTTRRHRPRYCASPSAASISASRTGFLSVVTAPRPFASASVRAIFE